jgi:LAO/AO transport system kinase
VARNNGGMRLRASDETNPRASDGTSPPRSGDEKHKTVKVDVGEWAAKVRAGEVRALSRGISAIEDHAAEAEELLRELFPATGNAYLTGVTGAPGTGKSTLVDRLAAYHRKKDERVGVVAVDPTSPYTGGAILGDRIRMQGHAGDSGIFIRSMATRGFLGGLARATAEVALLLDAAGKRQVLIETVGVGQDEIDIVRLADCVLVVMVPGLGDDIQNMKAGLMEIGDIFVLNKADREGADRLEEQLHAMLSLVMPRDGWHPPVMRTVATENRGIAELAETVAKFRGHFESSGERKRKQTEHWEQRLIGLLESRLLERVLGGKSGEEKLRRLAEEVAERKKDPFTAVNELLAGSGLA